MAGPVLNRPRFISYESSHMDLQAQSGSKPIIVWLGAVATLLFAMVVLGGVTRLTESGLSMVDWHPVTGWLPPLSDEAWLAEFNKYKASPEYVKENSWMTVDDFKGIFWFEFLHRLLGRLIGVAFALPFFWFLATKQVSKALSPKLWLLLVLGGGQGVLGWYMVKSGLVDRPDVSHFRLAAHLGLAFIIYGYILWLMFGLMRPQEGRLEPLAVAIAILIYLQIMSGAFVAGLDAGFIYNTWPLIDGHFFITGPYDYPSFWQNLLEDRKVVQFNHRIGAYIVAAVTALLWWRRRGDGLPAHLLAGATALQIVLGIVTLIAVVPVSLGALHQAGALILFSASLYAAFRLRKT